MPDEPIADKVIERLENVQYHPFFKIYSMTCYYKDSDEYQTIYIPQKIFYQSSISSHSLESSFPRQAKKNYSKEKPKKIDKSVIHEIKDCSSSKSYNNKISLNLQTGNYRKQHNANKQLEEKSLQLSYKTLLDYDIEQSNNTAQFKNRKRKMMRYYLIDKN